jgi:hypothetical protein
VPSIVWLLIHPESRDGTRNDRTTPAYAIVALQNPPTNVVPTLTCDVQSQTDKLRDYTLISVLARFDWGGYVKILEQISADTETSRSMVDLYKIRWVMPGECA